MPSQISENCAMGTAKPVLFEEKTSMESICKDCLWQKRAQISVSIIRASSNFSRYVDHCASIRCAFVHASDASLRSLRYANFRFKWQLLNRAVILSYIPLHVSQEITLGVADIAAKWEIFVHDKDIYIFLILI